jgi:RNA-binding protein
MKAVHTVTITVFVRPGEDAASIEKALKSLSPFDLEKEKLRIERMGVQGSEVFDGVGYDNINILKLILDKERHTNRFIDLLKEKLPESDLRQLADQDNRVDEECCFYLRLDKKKLLGGEWALTDGGDCFHIKMTIAAFPKKREVALQTVRKMFGQ